ncbi:MAG: hypothetical protein ACLQPD_18130 [Desulfomonilaceae bacterium]
MRYEFNAIIERDDDFRIVHCPEIPDATGQGRIVRERPLCL